MNSHDLDGVRFSSEVCSRRTQNPSLPAYLLIVSGHPLLECPLQGWKELGLLARVKERSWLPESLWIFTEYFPQYLEFLEGGICKCEGSVDWLKL